MKAIDLQNLFLSMNMCDNSIEYVVVLKSFLEHMGKNVDNLSMNEIIYYSLKELVEGMKINTIDVQEKHSCGGTLNTTYLLNNISYNQKDRFFNMPEQKFRIKVKEPKFSLDNLTLESEFIDCIDYLEFEDGTIVRLEDLNTQIPADGSLSELETFFNFITIDVLNGIMELTKNTVKIIEMRSCDQCGFQENTTTENFINIILLLFKEFLDIKESK